MIPADQLRAYHEQLARYCLQQAGECTAAELLEHMGTAAMMQGHPREAYTSLTKPSVAGILRALAGRGVVRQDGTRNNTRQARQEPLWRDQGDAPIRMPAAPGHVAQPQQAAPPPARNPPPPQGGLTQAQRMALLQAEFDDMQARMVREWESFRSRAARVIGLTGEVSA